MVRSVSSNNLGCDRLFFHFYPPGYEVILLLIFIMDFLCSWTHKANFRWIVLNPHRLKTKHAGMLVKWPWVKGSSNSLCSFTSILTHYMFFKTTLWVICIKVWLEQLPASRFQTYDWERYFQMTENWSNWKGANM